MLEIEVIKFEAMDVITTSGAAPEVPEHAVMGNCTNPGGHAGQVTISNGVMTIVCSHCGEEISATGSITGGR